MHYSEDANKQYHIQVGKGDVGRYVILPGDPKRCAKIAKYFDNPVLMADSREYVTYTGYLDGVEGKRYFYRNRRTFRFHCNGRADHVRGGYFYPDRNLRGHAAGCEKRDVVIANGAIRMEGTSKEYAPIESRQWRISR